VNRRVPNGTHGGVRGRISKRNFSYSITRDLSLSVEIGNINYFWLKCNSSVLD